MTPQRAGQIATHLRRLRGFRVIDPLTYAVAETLLFRLRRAGHDLARGSYDAIARLAGVGRTKAKSAVRQLGELGIITKATHRLLVRWGWNKCLTASRQDANTYEFTAASTEVAGRPTFTRESKKESLLNKKSPAGAPKHDHLTAALANLGAAIAARGRSTANINNPIGWGSTGRRDSSI